MTVTKRAFTVIEPLDPVFYELVARRSDILLTKLDPKAPRQDIEAVIACSHAYAIGATRSTTPPGLVADAQLLQRSPNLLVVSSHGAGYDSVDLEACTRAGIVAVNQSGGNAEAVAEHVLGMMLCLSKRIIETDRFMRRQPGLRREAFMGRNVLEKTLGIIGIGHVGTRLAQLCRGLEMRIIACDPYLPADEIARRGAQKSALEDLLRQSDFVSVNCPLTDETRGMLGARQYALMPKHAYFITTARGGIHDEAALEEALREHRIAGAGLDVWQTEPPPLSHPLLQLDNVLLSNHSAGVTSESRRTMAQIGAEQLIDVLDGKRPPRLLNPEAWPAYSKRFQRILGFAPAP